MKPPKYNIWWGPPRKFTSEISERKISWLELFYDLVYVIAIATITHHVAAHPTGGALGMYFYLFAMIYWSWLNGSMHHDLHGSPGIRTRLMTLWQMMAVAALIVCLNSPESVVTDRGTIAFMILQLYITYMWWSVGIYDKDHRRYNKPYTICFLLSFALMGLTFATHGAADTLLYAGAALLNFIPPFLVMRRLRAHDADFSLSPSMTERLGLFTIIVFGEAVIGVIQGTISAQPGAKEWLAFGLGILIVFALWWIFFALLVDREAQPGFLKSQIICLSYIPTLAALGVIGASFTSLLEASHAHHSDHGDFLIYLFGGSFTVFLLGITFISRFLIYPETYASARRSMRGLLITVAVIIPGLTAMHHVLSFLLYLLLICICLVVIVVSITRAWYKAELSTRPLESVKN